MDNWVSRVSHIIRRRLWGHGLVTGGIFMRVLRLSLTWTATVALLVLPTAMVVAHEEDQECPSIVSARDPAILGLLPRPHGLMKPITLTAAAPISEAEVEGPQPTGVVITSSWLDGTEPSADAETGSASVAIDDVRLFSSWEASDPRLSGDATYMSTWHYYPELDSELEAVRWTVVNDGGSWTGTGRGIYSPEAVYGDYVSAVLAGQDAYEGLTAYLMMDIAHEEGTIRGLIVADDMPPFPEPPAE